VRKTKVRFIDQQTFLDFYNHQKQEKEEGGVEIVIPFFVR
jgi:hypothetical protein